MVYDLADIVEVPVRCSLLSQELLVSIEHDMQVELLLQQHQAVVAETLDGSHGCNLAHPAVGDMSIEHSQNYMLYTMPNAADPGQPPQVCASHPYSGCATSCVMKMIHMQQGSRLGWCLVSGLMQ